MIGGAGFGLTSGTRIRIESGRGRLDGSGTDRCGVSVLARLVAMGTDCGLVTGVAVMSGLAGVSLILGRVMNRTTATDAASASLAAVDSAKPFPGPLSEAACASAILPSFRQRISGARREE